MLLCIVYRHSMEKVDSLYQQVRETIVRISEAADERLDRLHKCLQLREFQEEVSKVNKLGFKIIAPFLNRPYSKNGVLFCKFSFLYLKVQLFSFKLT